MIRDILVFKLSSVLRLLGYLYKLVFKKINKMPNVTEKETTTTRRSQRPGSPSLLLQNHHKFILPSPTPHLQHIL